MKFSYNWIRELVDGLDTQPNELMRLITMKTAECEGVEVAGAGLKGAALAEVLGVEPMPGGHNRRVRIRADGHGEKELVCGAPNCRVGMRTVYLPLGVKTIDGVASDGMLASAKELGIGSDHGGIVEIDTLDRITPDHVIEVDNKSLTHRPDLWGHHGMAREVAAIAHRPLRDPVDLSLLPTGAPAIQVHVEDFALCPRYSALVFENVTVQPSPPWLQYRLHAVGLNPINNIVDVTNFVMAELAQPMHAFDADRLHGDTIFVRAGRRGERVAALNGETYDVGPANLLIADAAGPIAIAGVIGGQGSAIGADTVRIVLESACFEAISVRKTSVELKLRTDASMRFEKSQDPANTVRGLARAIALLREVSPGIRLVGGLTDVRNEPKAAPVVDLPVPWLLRKLGRQLTRTDVAAILTSLGFDVEETVDDSLRVCLPSWRATKDVSMKDDLLEEVGRIIGYDSITPRAPLAEATVPPPNPERAYHRRVRDLVAAQGFTEVYNYSFVSVEMVAAFGFDPSEHVAVLNPIASDQTLLRVSLLPGIRKNILDNSRHLSTFRLFEIGREIHKTDGPGLPCEIPHLVAALYARDDGSAGLFELKGLALALMPGCVATSAEARPFEHPGRTAVIVWRGAVVGRLFELHPDLLGEGRAAVLDLDLALVEKLDQHDRKFQPLRKFPVSAFDLSVIVPVRLPAGVVQQELAEHAGAELVDLEFVRHYVGPPLPDGTKSVSFRLTFGASDRTLSSDEVGAARARIIEAMRAKGYELRV